MIIRQRFKFENAHIVRLCSTERCKYNVHGHSYKVEVCFESHSPQGVDAALHHPHITKKLKRLIDSFDHAITLWSGDEKEYISAMQMFSQRWILLPINPSAEQFARIIFLFAQLCTTELDLHPYSVTVHETDTGYAMAYMNDVRNTTMGMLSPIVFSPQIRSEWHDDMLLSFFY